MRLELMHGIQRFQGKTFKELEDIFSELGKGQNPDTLFITCSDSRIVPSLITQTNPGNLFVIRNVGNIIPPYPMPCSEAAAIEYAVDVLRVRDIVVCGHSGCGAMNGLLDENLKHKLPAVARWLTYAEPVLNQLEEKLITSTNVEPDVKLKAAIEFNILTQIEHLKTYQSVKEKVNRHEITISGWYYEIPTGKIFIYEPHYQKFLPFEKVFTQNIDEKIINLTQNIAMQYLKLQANPKTPTDYLKLMRLFGSLNENIKPIWPAIKEQLAKKIWTDLGFLFTDKSDLKFIELVESTANIKLPKLDSLQKEVSESPGYQRYCRQLLFTPRFFAPNQTISLPTNTVSNNLLSM
ncbi:carbonic anhydrase [Legionella sp. D16C41]|uniref:carbonic anhydrase n=1 Tax=Legionella sp. D16C41 TaxID=3402688 RepID=UPI003AF64C1E